MFSHEFTKQTKLPKPFTTSLLHNTLRYWTIYRKVIESHTVSSTKFLNTNTILRSTESFCSLMNFIKKKQRDQSNYFGKILIIYYFSLFVKMIWACNSKIEIKNYQRFRRLFICKGIYRKIAT